MSMSRMGQGHTVVGLGGAVLIVAIFATWTEGGSAWDVLSVVDVLMLLIAIAAIAFAVLPATGFVTAVPDAADRVLLALGLMVFGFAAGFELEFSGDIGVWLAILGSLGIALGAYESSDGGVLPARRAPAAPPPRR